MFTSWVANDSIEYLRPDELQQRGFRVDPEGAADSLRRLLGQVAGMGAAIDSIKRIADIPSRAQALVRAFSRAGLAGTCGNHDFLQPKLESALDGRGCCSDHTRLFMALGSTVGLFVREVQTASHAVTVVYDPHSVGWFYVDPTFAMMVVDDSGKWLSLADLRKRVINKLPIRFVFFGNSEHPHSMQDSVVRQYYSSPAAFERLVSAGGNNVFEQEIVAREINWLPKPARQLIMQLTGVRPQFVGVADELSNRSQAAERGKTIALWVGLLLGMLAASAWVLLPLRYGAAKRASLQR